MHALTISAESPRTVDAIWRLLINQEHGPDDLPPIGEAVVTAAGRRWRFSYEPNAYRWHSDAPVAVLPVPQDAVPSSPLDALRRLLDDELNLEHPLELVQWLTDQAEQLPAIIIDALDVYAMALEQSEAARSNLQRLAYAADRQQLVT